MIQTRDIIHIDAALCDGCGDCVTACHEGAIALVDGKAVLVSEIYCDGLGDCVGECPQGAITIEKREVAPFDAQAVADHLARRGAPVGTAGAGLAAAARHTGAGGGGLAARLPVHPMDLGAIEPEACGCPGGAARTFPDPAAGGASRPAASPGAAAEPAAAAASPGPAAAGDPLGVDPAPSALRTWPVQLRLLNPDAPYLQGADVLLCADCVPFAMSDLHQRFMAGRVPVVACPKLDDGEQSTARLAAICARARPRSITVLRMMVPCCGGLAGQLARAQQVAGTDIPVTVYVVEADGSLRPDRLAS